MWAYALPQHSGAVWNKWDEPSYCMWAYALPQHSAAHLAQQDQTPEDRPRLLQRQEGQQVHALILRLLQQSMHPAVVPPAQQAQDIGLELVVQFACRVCRVPHSDM